MHTMKVQAYHYAYSPRALLLMSILVMVLFATTRCGDAYR